MSDTRAELIRLIDEHNELELKWKQYKEAAVIEFLKSQGFDNPTQEPQRSEVYRRAFLERWPGSNRTEFFKWDGVRVLRFDNKERLDPATKNWKRRVVTLKPQHKDKSK